MGATKSPHSQPEKDQLLKTGQELITNWAQAQFNHFVQTMDERLFNMADKADNNKDQARLFQTRDEISRNQSFIEQQFFQHLSQSFANFRNQQQTAADYNTIVTATKIDNDEEQNLSLVDNIELEEELAIIAMSRKASADCSEWLYALNQRLSVLSGGSKITDQGNPIAPGVFGDALRQAISTLTLDNQPRILLYKVFESSFSAHLHKLYELLNQYFESHGVLPNLSYTIKKSNSAEQTEQLPTALQTQTSKRSIANQIQLFETIRSIQARLNPQGHLQTSSGHHHIPAAQIIAGIQQLQRNAGLLLSALATPEAVAASNPIVLRQKVEQQALQEKDVDEDIIEIVGLLFEYMLNDQQLPDAVKTLLSYLHTPFLKIALLDQDFFSHPDHPARQLLNSLVAAGERWVEPSGGHKSDVFQQIKNIVQRLLNEFDNNVRLLSELAFEFNHYLRQHARRILLAEQRAMQAAKGEDKLKEIRMRVDAYLKKKIGQLELPASLRTLLFEPWANFLSFNLLRFGSNSQEWRQAAQAVDDILWYSQPHSSDDWHARKRVQELKATLPDILIAGFETVGYDSTQGKRLLAELEQQQKNMPLTGSSKPTAVAAANIDDVNISKQNSDVKNDKLVTELKQTKLDSWFEFDTNSSQPERLKLAWSNTDTLHFMFVNRLGQQVSIKTGQQLAAGIRSGSIKPLGLLEDKPFFEKAMARVLVQLQQREKPSDNGLN